MATPNQAYLSNSVPFGGFSVSILRPTDPDSPTSNPTTLGTYLVESITPSYNGILGKRPAVDGGDNGWWLVNGTIEGSGTIQLPTLTSPTLKNGDYFTVTSIEADANGAAVSRKFVIHSPSTTISTSDYRKQNVSVIVDRF